jgi:hypothetical protein
MDLKNSEWRKSKRSSENGGNCVEVKELWRTSRRSTDNGGDCVEVRVLDD